MFKEQDNKIPDLKLGVNLLREFQVEVLLSFDKEYDDIELHSCLISIQHDPNMTEKQIQDKVMIESFEQISKENGRGIRHSLEINSLKEIKR